MLPRRKEQQPGWWKSIEGSGRRVWSGAKDLQARDSQGFSVERKWVLAALVAVSVKLVEIFNLGHSLHIRKFSAPLRFVRPFTQRRPSTSSPQHIATRRIKPTIAASITRYCPIFCCDFLCPSADIIVKGISIRGPLTSGLG